MNTVKYQRAAGLYYSCEEAESAVRALKYAGYDMDRISVIARDTNYIAGEATEKVGNKADEGATAGAFTGGALGSITGLLVGLGALAIPGIGPILLAGAEATTIATTLAGAGVGAAAGSLVGAFIGLGIPEAKAKLYSDRVESGSFLIMVTGTSTEIARVKTIMSQYGVEEFNVYDLPNTETQTTDPANMNLNSDINLIDRQKIKLNSEGSVANKQRIQTEIETKPLK